MTEGFIYIYWRIFEANFIRLLSSKISQLETLKLLEVRVIFQLWLLDLTNAVGYNFAAPLDPTQLVTTSRHLQVLRSWLHLRGTSRSYAVGYNFAAPLDPTQLVTTSRHLQILRSWVTSSRHLQILRSWLQLYCTSRSYAVFSENQVWKRIKTIMKGRTFNQLPISDYSVTNKYSESIL